LEVAVAAALCTGGFTWDVGDKMGRLFTVFTAEGGGGKDKGWGKNHLQEEILSVVLTHKRPPEKIKKESELEL
jgi:hypothetical protein